MQSEQDAVRTMCAYCGVGCGMVLQITTDPESGRRHIAKSVGQENHPANFGRLCTKGATTSDFLAAPGRADSAAGTVAGSFIPWGSGKGGATANPSRRCRLTRGDAWLRGAPCFSGSVAEVQYPGAGPTLARRPGSLSRTRRNR